MSSSLTPPPSYQVYPTAATPSVDPYQTGYQAQPAYTGVPTTPYGYSAPVPEYAHTEYHEPVSHVALEIGTSPQYASHYSQPGYSNTGGEPLATDFFSPPRAVPITGEHSVFFSKPPYEVTDDDKLWALLCYVLSPIIPVVVFFLSSKRLRPFIKSHYAQALVLGFINLILWSVLTWILSLLFLIPFGLWLGLVFLGIMAYQGNEIHLPLLSPLLQSNGFA